MDELWKDMSLCSTPVSLQSYHLHSPAAHPYRGAVYLQDYLASANSVPPQAPRTPPPPPPPPNTALSLEFTYLGGANSAASSGDDPGHFGFSLSGDNDSRSNHRRSSAVLQPAAVGGDRRQRRMIKNRESAARSRARKQAYTNELELELEQLRRENKMLIQREKDFINDCQAKAAPAQLAVPDCRSRRRSTTSGLQQKQHQQRCRSAPPP